MAKHTKQMALSSRPSQRKLHDKAHVWWFHVRQVATAKGHKYDESIQSAQKGKGTRTNGISNWKDASSHNNDNYSKCVTLFGECGDSGKGAAHAKGFVPSWITTKPTRKDSTSRMLVTTLASNFMNWTTHPSDDRDVHGECFDGWIFEYQ